MIAGDLEKAPDPKITTKERLILLNYRDPGEGLMDICGDLEGNPLLMKSIDQHVCAEERPEMLIWMHIIWSMTFITN